MYLARGHQKSLTLGGGSANQRHHPLAGGGISQPHRLPVCQNHMSVVPVLVRLEIPEGIFEVLDRPLGPSMPQEGLYDKEDPSRPFRAKRCWPGIALNTWPVVEGCRHHERDQAREPSTALPIAPCGTSSVACGAQ